MPTIEMRPRNKILRKNSFKSIILIVIEEQETRSQKDKNEPKCINLYHNPEDPEITKNTK